MVLDLPGHAVLIECNTCSATVDAKIIGERVYGPDDRDDPRQIVLLECPVCESPLLGWSELEPTEAGNWGFRTASRIWPVPNNTNLHHTIPEEVRRALTDAKKCFDAGVYTATAVMCGKAIESICREKTGLKTIVKGLERMKAQSDIDDRLWNWADALRKERNLGAHATGHQTDREDAEDILAFAVAICEYVYVLTEQYKEYMARKENI